MYYIVYSNFLASGRKQGYVHGYVFVGACVEIGSILVCTSIGNHSVLVLTLKL